MRKIYIDMLGEAFKLNAEKRTAGKISYQNEYWNAVDRYNEMMAKLKEFDYVSYEEEVADLVSKSKSPEPDVHKLSMVVLRNSPKKVILTTSYATVRDMVYTMLSGADYIELAMETCGKCKDAKVKGCVGCKFRYVPIAQRPEIIVLNVYEPRRIKVLNAQDWSDVLAAEKAKKRDYAIEQERITDAEVVLATHCPWIGYNSLDELRRCFESFEDFMEYTNGISEAILREGCWDNDVATATSFVDARSTYTSVYQGPHVELRGKRVSHAYGQGKTFETTTVTDSDKLTQFLSLTFYKAAGFRPMAKMAMKSCYEDHGYGVEPSMKLVVMDPEEEFEAEFFKLSQLRTTPIYVTPHQILRQYSKGDVYNLDCRYELPEVRES